MIRQDYAPKAPPAPWYTPLIYFVSTVLMAYALIYLATGAVEATKCWVADDSTGCIIIRGESDAY